MQPIRSFIVRLYRRDRHEIAGVVEDVRSGRSTPFSSIATLWTALTRPARSSTTTDSAADGAPARDEHAPTRRDDP